MTGFIQMPKGFKNLLKMYLEKSFQKMKREFFLSLFPPFQFGLMGHSFSLARPHFPSPSFSSLLGRPGPRCNRCRVLVLPLWLTAWSRTSAPSPPTSSSPASLALERNCRRAHAPSWERLSPRASGLLKRGV
jgi:hypothetical protein